MDRQNKLMLRALRGETLATPPIWMMRQAGRYLPEYMATRAQAGDFLSLCYNPDLASEVTHQPIRRYGFDAAILFADILLIPQALGAKLWFVTGEGPRLSTITDGAGLDALGPVDDIDATLAPIYETVARLAAELPDETALIGFAGAPWTVATYMIAGRGTPAQEPAHALINSDVAVFEALLDKITQATIHYLCKQIEAGAEIVKIFDSWAGTLKGDHFDKYSVEPARQIIAALRARHPNVAIIGFPRGATEEGYVNYARVTGADCVAIDGDKSADWAARELQPITCVQGNLDQRLLVSGGDKLVSETKRICETLGHGPHIFNLGHGITPDADPENVARMIDAVRN
ncbi:uroporphyrinogen decarboxylase [Amylibacter marinus]|uniref:Uroporphyrinogen decarboxylase n=1 Tax=Amylibacter marinus TaxID=1475483 RepID=A0ABQ5VYK8_9RHOB|nr:uroporphyrinogen decarboxylase [Amylibacter marinus]GLQ36363.1 uroporphyrinogen decarboxylase [Amylibacter marinus]